MRVDLPSFGLGFATASALAFVMYRYRARLSGASQGAAAGMGKTRQFISTGAEGRYRSDLAALLNKMHLAGEHIELKDVHVEPRFIRPREIPDPLSEDPVIDPFGILPLFHDMPAAYSPYNIDTMTISDLRSGATHLALLGIPGLGKTTALALIALTAMGEIRTTTIDILEDKLFEEEIAGMPDDERQKAIERRKQLATRALEQLKQEKLKKAEEKPTREVNFAALLPIYVHMKDIDLDPAGYAGKAVDPAEPVVKALQGQFNPITAGSLPRLIYKRLAAGTCLVLIDGFDEMPADLRPEKLAWLQQFMEIYAANFVIVAGPETGYHPLTQLGLTPIYLRPWMEHDQKALAETWAVNWPQIAEERKAAVPDERILRRVLTNNRGRTALDFVVKMWAAYSGDEQELGRRGWYDSFVRRRLDKNTPRQVVDAIAGAVLGLDGMPLSKEQLKEIGNVALTGEDGKAPSNVESVIDRIVGRSGLLTTWAGGKCNFIHPLIIGYLGAESLAGADADTVALNAEKPAWEIAMPFAAAFLPVENAATARLNAEADLMYTALFSLAPWTTDAPPDAKWRADAFKKFTAAMIAPRQFPMVRERAMAALVMSKDRNIIFIFRQALRSVDPVVRRLGCLGLGTHGDPEVTKDLAAMLEDQNPDVKLAAGLGLGALGTEAAIESMVVSLVYGEQGLRRAVAETLSAIPGEGYAVLREAIGASDMMLRHAAVFGLARIKAAWAVATLYKTLLEDEQWYVRNAAEEAFLNADNPEKSGVMVFPEPDQIPWLVQWAASKGDSVPAGERSRQMLVRGLQEGDARVKAASALSLARLGQVSALKPLYSALRDQDEIVRSVVFSALSTMQQQLGEPLPNVN